MFTIPPHAFWLDIAIHENDIDALNHVNNIVYLKWVQQVATAHWQSVTTAEQRHQWWWVVHRHEIDYLRPCFLQDSVRAYTWVMPAETPTASHRVVVFKNKATGKVITQVKTTWVLVDPATQRGTTIPAHILALFGL